MISLGLTVTATAPGRGPAAGGPAAPTNLTAPTIGGIAMEGETLTLTPGTWSGAGVSLTHVWTRDGVDIAGATGTSFTLTAADEGALIACRESASNAGGSVSALANAVGPVSGPAFVSASYGQAVPASLIVSTFATGDAAPSGANGGTWQNGTGDVSGGTINDVAQAAFGARFELAATAGGNLVTGRDYVAVAEIVARDPSPGASRFGVQVQGPGISMQDMYSFIGGHAVRGVANYAFTAIGTHSYLRFDKPSGCAMSLDNLALYDVTDQLAKPIDLYIVAGQSNSIGNENFSEDGTGLSVAEAALDPRVLYLPGGSYNGDGGNAVTNAGKPQLLCNPLQHQTQNRGIGPGVSFASSLADVTPDDRQIVLVTAAWAGEALVATSGRWNRNGSAEAYDGLVDLVGDFLAAHPGATVRGLLWCQGEADRSSGPAAKANYVTAFQDELIAPLRALWGDFPAVILSMRENVILADAGGTNIDDAQKEIAAGDPLIAYVRGTIDADEDGTPEDVAADFGTFGEAIHYTRGQQALNGVACAEALMPLLNLAYG